MRAAVAALFVWSFAAAQEPLRPSAVVVLPREVRDSLSAAWSASNLNWDWVPSASTPSAVATASRPTRSHFGCLTGYATSDTLWVTHLMPAADVRRRQFSVTGDCSRVADVIGTWHTHPYRPGYEGRVVKERGLSGLDFKTFAAGAYPVTIVVWDTDSIDLALKTSEGLRHPAPVIVR